MVLQIRRCESICVIGLRDCCCPCLQVPAELGYPNEDQGYLLEPDHLLCIR